MNLLPDLDAIVREVVEEHDLDETALRARVAEKLGAALKARGFDPIPELEQEAVRLLPVN